MNLPMDTNMNRYNKPVQTPVGGAEMAKPAFNRQTQREMMTAAEVGRKLGDLTEPSRCQGTAVEAEGAVTGAILSAPYRCCDCGIRITAGRNSVTDGDECRELMPSITCQVGSKTAPLNDTRRRQYRLKSHASVGGGLIYKTPGSFWKYRYSGCRMCSWNWPRRPGTVRWWTTSQPIGRMSSPTEPGRPDRFSSQKS